MDLELKGRTALVTGASRGLGRATAEALLAEGANLVVVARASAELAALEAAYPGRCIAVAGDLRDPSVPQHAVETALRIFRSLDVVVVNTPGPMTVQPLEASESDFAVAFDTVFYPALRLIKAAAEPMGDARWGRILIVSSTSVKAPKPFLCLSGASRSALWSWAKSAAPALYQQGITINALFAGPHDTERARQLGVKADRVMGQPADFGRFVCSLCGDNTRFITGTGYLIDGGELQGA
jgi:3-oxoacyl-[acyl-carrier protein] reductase